MLSRHLFIGVVAICFKTSSSLPSIDFPIQAQIPPVAVVDKLFSFTFSPDTFTSSFTIEYSARNLPEWLQFEASKSTFSGVPSRSDVGNVEFELKATDPKGTVSTRVTLIVINESLVQSNKGLFVDRLTRSQSYSAPNTLLLHPQTYFDLNLGPDIFEGSENSLIHYATSNDNAPLPAWIHFDDQAVRFSGTTPSLLTSQSSPQIFNFAVLASHFRGFSQSRLGFHIAVTNHILAFIQPFQSFNVSPGQAVSIPPLLSQVRYDSQSIPRDQLIDVSSNRPNWLEFDSNDLSLHGIAPANLNDFSFSIEATDNSRNTAVIDIDIHILSSDGTGLREIDLGEVIAVAGEYFSYTFNRIASTNATSLINVDVDLGSDNSWLTFSQTNNSIQGFVPIDVVSGSLKISATIREDGQPVEKEHLTLLLVASSRTSSSSSASQPNPSAIRSGQPANGPNESEQPSWKKFLPLIITIPIMVLLVVGLIVTLMIKKAQKRRAARMLNTVGIDDSVENNSSGNVVIVADSCSEFGSDQSQRLTYLVPEISRAQPDQRPPTRRPLLADNSASIESPESRSSWDDMLLEVHDISPGQTRSVSLSTNRLDPGVVGHTSAPVHADRRSVSTSSGTHNLAERFGNIHESAPCSRFGISKTGGQSHGTSMHNTPSAPYQATLRYVPLSPLSISSMEMARMNETESVERFHSHDIGGLSSEAVANAFINPTAEAKRMSVANSDSNHTKLKTPRSSRRRQHNWRRSRSTSFSGSIWDDDEWTTQNSISKSGNSQTQGQGGMTSNYSNEMVLEDRRIRRWIHGPSTSDIGGVAGSMSMRSQGSEPSQSHSLRFI